MWLPLLSLAALVASARAHGRVLEPASRASAWRFGFNNTLPDYNDDGVNCGGFDKQWSENGGRCGICGDPYQITPPRPHELGGKYGQGVITGKYLSGSLLNITVELTTSHLGFWEFKLCDDPENNEQACFDKHILELEDGGTKFYPTQESKKYYVTYRLPKGMICDHCVLQWRYTAGNRWGDCKNGTQALGCGNQETFGACSDITIEVTNTSLEKDQGNSEKTPLEKDQGSNEKTPLEKDQGSNEKTPLEKDQGSSEKTPLEKDQGSNEIPYPLYYYKNHIGYFDTEQGKELSLTDWKVLSWNLE